MCENWYILYDFLIHGNTFTNYLYLMLLLNNHHPLFYLNVFFLNWWIWYLYVQQKETHKTSSLNDRSTPGTMFWKFLKPNWKKFGQAGYQIAKSNCITKSIKIRKFAIGMIAINVGSLLTHLRQQTETVRAFLCYRQWYRTDKSPHRSFLYFYISAVTWTRSGAKKHKTGERSRDDGEKIILRQT
jgi:hypothetical protein